MLPAGIAQLVEQRTENPRVPGSSPGPGIMMNQTNYAVRQGFQTFYGVEYKVLDNYIGHF